MEKNEERTTRDRGGERHILVAVDGSDNAKRAVLYVADFFGGLPGFVVTLLTIIPEPSEDYFATDKEREGWLEEQRTVMAAKLDEYSKMLHEAGFAKTKVKSMLEVVHCDSVAEHILAIQQKLRCCTVVVGRRGISKKEEFIFGSISNKILHEAKNCAVLVVE